MAKHSRGRNDTSQTLDRLMGRSAVDGALDEPLSPSKNTSDTSGPRGRAEGRQVPVGKATAAGVRQEAGSGPA